MGCFNGKIKNMKQTKITLLFMVSVAMAYSQQTERYKALINTIKAKDTSSYVYYHNNDSIKETGKHITYVRPEYTYSKKFEEIKTFYNTGQLKSIEEYDAYGNILNAQFYNIDGTTWWKSKTLEIDSELTNMEEYFTKENHIIITKELWEYKLGTKERYGEIYLRAVGKVKNEKKIGEWILYNELGKVEEKVNYN